MPRKIFFSKTSEFDRSGVQKHIFRDHFREGPFIAFSIFLRITRSQNIQRCFEKLQYGPLVPIVMGFNSIVQETP